MELFADLIPQQGGQQEPPPPPQTSGGLFDDLMPKAQGQPGQDPKMGQGLFDDLMPPPSLSPSRLGGAMVEGFKEGVKSIPAGVEATSRVFDQAGGVPNVLGPVGRGMEALRPSADTAALAGRALDSALPENPAYKGQTSGRMESAVRGLAEFAPSMAAGVVNPVLGVATTYDQIAGGKYRALTEQGVPSERAAQAATSEAAVSTPLYAGAGLFNLGVIGRSLGKSPLAMKFGEALAGANAMGVVGALSSIPSQLADTWAKNPDMTLEDAAKALGQDPSSLMEGMKEGYLGNALASGMMHSVPLAAATGKAVLGRSTKPGEQAAPPSPADTLHNVADAQDAQGQRPSFVDRVIGPESSGDPNIKNTESTARGLGQFVKDTRNVVLKESGLDAWSSDPAEQRKAMEYLAEKNRRSLVASLGREPTYGEQYMAWFLGDQGAKDFFGAMAENPDAPATSAVRSKDVVANKAIFFEKDGRPRTLAEVFDLMGRKVGDEGRQDMRQRPAPREDIFDRVARENPDAWPVRPELDALREDMRTRSPEPAQEPGGAPDWNVRTVQDAANDAAGFPRDMARENELRSLRNDMQAREVQQRVLEEQGFSIPTREAERLNERPALPEGQGFELGRVENAPDPAGMKFRDLVAYAKDLGISNTAKTLKPDLVEAVRQAQRDRTREAVEAPQDMRVQFRPESRTPEQFPDADQMLGQAPTRFSLADKANPGIPRPHVQHVVDKLQQDFQGVAPVRVISRAEIPRAISYGMDTSRIEGWTEKRTGTVYLVHDNLRSPNRATEVWAHEQAAHVGLPRLLGEERFNKVLDVVRRDYGLRDNVAAEEHLARIAEKLDLGQTLTSKESFHWRRVVDIVRSWLAERGISMSPKNLEAMLRQSLRNMAKGEDMRASGGVEPAVAFSAGRVEQDAADYGRRVKEVSGAWSKVVDDAVAGGVHSRTILKIGDTPDMLVRFGLPKLPMVMNKDTLDKMIGARAKNGHVHELTLDQVKDIYRHLSDPVAFVRETRSNAVVLTEMQENGKSIIVPIQVNTEGGRIQVNAIASAFGKTSVGSWLERHAADGNLVYLDKKRAAALKDMSGNQLSRVLQARLQSRMKLLTEGDVVKPEMDDRGPVRLSLARSEEDHTIQEIGKASSRLHFVARHLTSPEYWKHPVQKTVFEVFRNRQDRAHEILHTALDTGDGKTIMDAWNGLDKPLRKTLSDIVKIADEREIPPHAVESWMEREAIPEPVREVWRLMREKYDALLEERLKPYEDFLSKGHNPDITYRDSKGKMVTMSLRESVNEMRSLQGFYAPRGRPEGEYAVTARRQGPDGEWEYARHHVDWWPQARLKAAELRKQGWDITGVDENRRLGESTQQAIARIGEVASVVREAAQNLKGVPDEARQALMSQLVEDLSTEIKSRGFRSSAIRRTGRNGRAVQGYIEDAGERFAQYAQRTAYGIAKMEAAQDAVKALFATDADGKLLLDPRRDRQKFEATQKYIHEQLRNPEKADRVISLAKAISTVKYLGFGVRSAAVNLTTLATQVPPALRVYATDSKAGLSRCTTVLGKSFADAASLMMGRVPKGMTADERLYWEDIRKKDLDDPQMTRELAKTYQSTAGKVFSGFTKLSMSLFSVTERFNRLSTLLSGYRMAREAGFSHADAMERAQLASDRAHGVYGREAMPEATWGTNAGAQAAQTTYIYQKYAHNTFLLMADVLGKKDAKAFMHLLAAPMVLAGDKAGTAWLGYLGAKALLSAISPDDKRDPRERLMAWIREVMGETWEKVARSGLIGWMLGVDVSGSMDTAIRIPKNLEDLGGAPWGVAKDLFGEHGAVHYLSTGQPGKALEKVLPAGIAKPVQALRESREGVTDSRGVRLVDEQGKPYKPTEEETWAKAFGFRPVREARVRDITEAARTEERGFQERRQAIFEEYRAWANGGKEPEALTSLVEKIRQFNADVDRMDRPNISPITKQGLETQLVNMESPNRKELGRVGIGEADVVKSLGPEDFDMAERRSRFKVAQREASRLYDKAMALAEAGSDAEATRILQGGVGEMHDLVTAVSGELRKIEADRNTVENAKLDPTERTGLLGELNQAERSILDMFTQEARSIGGVQAAR